MQTLRLAVEQKQYQEQEEKEKRRRRREKKTKKKKGEFYRASAAMLEHNALYCDCILVCTDAKIVSTESRKRTMTHIQKDFSI